LVENRKQRGEEIRRFILRNIVVHPKDITQFTVENFNVSRPGVLRHIRALIDEGLIAYEGKTRGRTYSLRPISAELFTIHIVDGLEEDVIWRERVLPVLANQRKNVLDICQYGFTEMFNNVLEHSDASKAIVSIKLYPHDVQMSIDDNGVGIFNKIQNELGLYDKRHAILELAKGKLTTDPVGHTGEGVFFTSRMFDKYSILSSDLYFAHSEPGDDWLLQDEKLVEGTFISMNIDPLSERSSLKVFNKYSLEGSYGFDRTRVPVSLSRYSEENLISRSQARRLLARFDRFKEVFLNFKGVETIGQAFADEIFRVFKEENPGVKIIYVNTNSQVRRMICRIKGIRPNAGEN